LLTEHIALKKRLGCKIKSTIGIRVCSWSDCWFH